MNANLGQAKNKKGQRGCQQRFQAEHQQVLDLHTELTKTPNRKNNRLPAIKQRALEQENRADQLLERGASKRNAKPPNRNSSRSTGYVNGPTRFSNIST
jgi:hypothetical protein